jgi:hypothetical protein
MNMNMKNLEHLYSKFALLYTDFKLNYPIQHK